MLIDTHAHLCDEVYGGAEEIISSMESDALSRIITVAYDLPSSEFNRQLCKKHKNIYFAAGVHPNNADEKSVSVDECKRLFELSKDPKCVAIGEIGLDYHYESTNKENQKEALEKQLCVAEEADLPVAFHVRDAYEDAYEIIKRHAPKLRKSAVMHCFSGSLETAKQYLDMGFYISFSGSVTFKNAKKFPEIIKNIPLDRILVETDSPYLTPHPYRGQTNYPRFVHLTAQRIAEILEKDEEEIAKATTENAYRLFTKMK